MKEKKRGRKSKGKVMKMKRRGASNSSLCHRITCSAPRRSRGKGQCILLLFAHTQEETQPCPELTCSNKTPLTHRQPPSPAARSGAIVLHSLTGSPASFRRNPTLTESDSCHQTERKGNLALALIQRRPPLCPP